MTLAIGQQVFAAVENSYRETFVTCTDCLGQRALTVILGDGSQVSIACQGCDHGGFRGSTGQMLVHGYEAHVQSGVITGIEVVGERLRYSMNGRRTDDVFATAEEAQARVDEMRAGHEAEEAAKPAQKVKPSKNWAWHVTYHRAEIKRQERSIEYHKAALAVAKQKTVAKETPR